MSCLSKIKKIILDTLFPIHCLSCSQNDVWLCRECLEKIPLLNFQVCPQCERIITDQGKLCLDCQRKNKTNHFHLEALLVATKYNENNISKLIHLYKYNFIQDLSAPLGKIVSQGILKNNLTLPDFIIPVPLHPRRLRWRGFNQSALLAKIVSKNLTPGFEIPILDGLLLRKKHNPPQMKIKKYADRKLNIQNSFIINPKLAKKIKNKKILLIDDIATTASTLLECARIIKENDAKKVFATVIARQEFKK